VWWEKSEIEGALKFIDDVDIIRLMAAVNMKYAQNDRSDAIDNEGNDVSLKDVSFRPKTLENNSETSTSKNSLEYELHLTTKR
jgi:hypothetical protein